MQRLLAPGLFLLTAVLFAAPCAPSGTRLCLNGNRFAAEVTWRDFQGNTGSGHPVSLTGDTGYFWFFSSTNVELVVKALDGRGINNNYWVFYGALSNVEYTMTVTDTVTGRTKVYANPSGNLGSVADTSAFAATGAVPAGRAVGVRSAEGAKRDRVTASAAASCAPTATSLCLNGGRFRAEVTWRDFAGNKGVGQAIALTADTGYFWFFNAANVELVVKVLDGRALNKDFWVFYGALSTVEYQLEVTDTVTGRTSFYFNPANNLASVADTSALGDGAFVQAVHDTSRAVTETVPIGGGSLAATGADGSRFTLTIPAGALLSEESVTLTPASAIGGLPLSGGLAAAVHIEPEGLLLNRSATLTIEPALAVPRNQAVTFSYQGAGAEFFLQPPIPVAGAIQLPVMHFSGYGVGLGTQADLDAQAQRLPTLEVDQFAQRLAVLVLPLFRSGAIGSSAPASGASAQAGTQVVCGPGLNQHFHDEYANSIVEKLVDIAHDCEKLRFRLPFLREYLQSVEWNGCTASLERETGNVRDFILSGQTFCFLSAFNKCVQDHDPAQVGEIERWAFELRRDGHGDVADPAKEHRCLTFTLAFETDMEQHSDVILGGPQWGSRAHLETSKDIPIRFNESTQLLDGAGPVDYKSAGFTGRADANCTIEVSPRNGSTFTVKALELLVEPSLGYVPAVPIRLRLHYDIGNPTESVHKFCSKPDINETQTTGFFKAAYDAAHTIEFDFDPTTFSFGYVAEMEIVGGRGQYATRTYETTDFMPPGEGSTSSERHLSENTGMSIVHTPQ